MERNQANEEVSMLSLYQRSKVFQTLAVAGLFFWAVSASVVAIYKTMQPEKIILVGADQYGMRVITRDNDPVLKFEAPLMIHSYIKLAYDFDQTNYRNKIMQAGGYVSEELWLSLLDNHKALADKLDKQALSQSAQIDDLIQIDTNRFEAHLSIAIRLGTTVAHKKLKIEFSIDKKKRNSSNPYEWEISRINETEVI